MKDNIRITSGKRTVTFHFSMSGYDVVEKLKLELLVREFLENVKPEIDILKDKIKLIIKENG